MIEYYSLSLLILIIILAIAFYSQLRMMHKDSMSKFCKALEYANNAGKEFGGIYKKMLEGDIKYLKDQMIEQSSKILTGKQKDDFNDHYFNDIYKRLNALEGKPECKPGEFAPGGYTKPKEPIFGAWYDLNFRNQRDLFENPPKSALASVFEKVIDEVRKRREEQMKEAKCKLSAEHQQMIESLTEKMERLDKLFKRNAEIKVPKEKKVPSVRDLKLRNSYPPIDSLKAGASAQELRDSILKHIEKNADAIDRGPYHIMHLEGGIAPGPSSKQAWAWVADEFHAAGIALYLIENKIIISKIKPE